MVENGPEDVIEEMNFGGKRIGKVFYSFVRIFEPNQCSEVHFGRYQKVT